MHQGEGAHQYPLQECRHLRMLELDRSGTRLRYEWFVITDCP